MTRKKKVSRKQLKKQRRAAMARKRAETGWLPPTEQSAQPVDNVIAAMFDVFEHSPTAVIDEEMFVTLLTAGEDWLDEPEFQDIFASPFEATRIVEEITSEFGLDNVERLSEEELDDFRANAFAQMNERLLTDEIRLEIVDALGRFHRRLLRIGQKAKAAKVKVIRELLRSEEYRSFWPAVGLVFAIMLRSLRTGWELIDASLDVEYTVPDTLPVEWALQTGRTSRAHEMLQKIPGLSKYLEKELDAAWEEGFAAMVDGDLVLGIYSLQELMETAEIVANCLGFDPSMPSSSRLDQPTPEELNQLVEEIDRYVTNLFSPDRLDLLKNHLQAVSRDPDFPREYLSFLFMLQASFREGDPLKTAKGFLTQTLFLELEYTAAMRVEEKAPD